MFCRERVPHEPFLIVTFYDQLHYMKMRTLCFLFVPLLALGQTSKNKIDWRDFNPPGKWVMEISESTSDYFGFGGIQGKIVFTLNAKTVVYYSYKMDVREQISSGKYAAFFNGKNCQEYSSWKEGGFPNFEFKNRVYLIDLCKTAPYLSQDEDYWSLSKSLFHFTNH
jgi:hypothetical protein